MTEEPGTMHVFKNHHSSCERRLIIDRRNRNKLSTIATQLDEDITKCMQSSISAPPPAYRSPT